MAGQEYEDMDHISIPSETDSACSLAPFLIPPHLQISDLSPTFLDGPMSKYIASTATSSPLVASNMKVKLLEFCTKINFVMPHFTRRQDSV